MCIIKAFAWYGGKIRFLTKLWYLIPPHKIWAEPFMGSAALTLNHARSQIEIINDLDSDLVVFMRTLADPEKGNELIRRLYRLEYSKEVFEDAIKQRKNGYARLNDVERSEKVFITITQSYNTTRKSYGKGKMPTWKYRRDIQYNLPLVRERLQGVTILNEDAVSLISRYIDNSDAFLFLDPPYLHRTRGKNACDIYGHEMPDEEQIALLQCIQKAKCKIMLCGYRENGDCLYDQYLLRHGWKCYKILEVPKSCQKKETLDMGHEFIWVNYSLPEIAKYIISLKEYGTKEKEAV